MCGLPATSKEHVPPLCLFPELKDISNLNFRKDLITVPSCEEHNSKKSKEDEFLMVSIAAIVGNNGLGYLHTRTKIDRTVRRKSERFLTKEVIKNAKFLTISSKNGIKFPVLIGNPDIARLNKSFEHIAYGLYYHEFGEVFNGKCKIIMGFLQYENEDTNLFIKFIRDRFDLETLRKGEKGNNPEVFKYQFCTADENAIIGLKLTFYGGAEVFIAFQPNGIKEPFNFGIFLMGKGVHTVFSLGDKDYEFNKSAQSPPFKKNLKS